VKLPINLFDVVLIMVLVAGVMAGRRHGLSKELLSVLKWMTLLLGCAAIYEPVGTVLAEYGVFDLLSAYLVAYLAAGLLILLLFSLLERRLAPKLVRSDVFGRTEYYLGMGSGMVRFGCILLVLLALLNARAFTPAEVKALNQYEQETYGTDIFPTLRNMQQTIFQDSFTGTLIKQDLGFLLIQSTPPAMGPVKPAPPTQTTAKR
jgi:uncharacterized membrane protein required for colicin V production